MATWVENLHPRVPRGQPGGGQFAEKGGAGGYLLDDDDRKEVAKYNEHIDRKEAILALSNRSIQTGVSEKFAVKTYTEGQAFAMNRALRSEEEDIAGASAKTLATVIERSKLPEDIALFRVISKEGQFNSMLGTLKPGDMLLDKGFISTVPVQATYRSAAAAFMKILAPKGSKALLVGNVQRLMPDEIILQRNSRLEYMGEDADGTKVFKLNQEGERPSDEEMPETERPPSKKFNPEEWRAMGMQKARAEWGKLTREQRDAYADARDSARKRLHDIVGSKVPAYTGNAHRDIAERVKYLSSILPAQSIKRVNSFAVQAHDILGEASDDKEGVANLTLSMLDHVAAQEFEGMGRSLGDHGEHHIEQDEHVALKLLSLLPENVNTPNNRAMMVVAAAYHDMGYLTEPSRVFLNVDHPRWSTQYYQENVAPQVSKLFGKNFSEMTASLISTHSDSEIDWENKPEQSCFSVADNLALFQEEKMPPLLRDVKGNTKVLVDLGRGKIKLDEAQKKMRENIKASDLSTTLKAQALRAVKEVSGVLPKYTLGMLGCKLGEISWKEDHPLIEVERHTANEALCKILDFGQKQFEKLAETYNHSGEEFLRTGQMILKNTAGKTLLEVRLAKGTTTHRRMRTREPWL